MKSILLCILLLAASPLFADGLLKVKSEGAQPYIAPTRVEIATTIRDQVAVTVSRQTFRNTSGRELQISYGFPLGINASVSDFRWWQNDELHIAAIDDNPQSNGATQGPGGKVDHRFVDYLGPSPLLFAFNEPIADGAELIVELTFIELLHYSLGEVEYRYPLGMSTFVSGKLDLSFKLDLASQRELLDIRIESHPQIALERGIHTVLADYSNNEESASRDLRLNFSLNQDDLGVFLLSHKAKDEAGYFIMLAEPDPQTSEDEIIEKTFTYVIDISGSMSGQKLDQAKAAARYAIGNLNRNDKFNVVSFNHSVIRFRPQPVAASAANVAEALEHIDGLQAGGGTNIQDALINALVQDMPDHSANILIFLTDGQATVFHQQLNEANTKNVRIFVFGIGPAVKEDLLRVIADDNNGVAEFLGSDDVDDRISDFYNKIADPILQNVEVAFPAAGTHEIYPQNLPDLYVGQQLTLAGRYNKPGPSETILTGTVYDETREYRYDVVFADGPDGMVFIPKMWAKLKIDHLLVLMAGVPDKSNQWKEWRDEIIRISKKYGILSPFTSFVDAGPADDDDTGGTQDEEEEDPVLTEVYDEEIEFNRNEALIESAFPNPFRHRTALTLRIPASASARYVVLTVVNARGEVVALLFEGWLKAGDHTIQWDGLNDEGVQAADGSYFFVLQHEAGREVYPVLLLR